MYSYKHTAQTTQTKFKIHRIIHLQEVMMSMNS